MNPAYEPESVEDTMAMDAADIFQPAEDAKPVDASESETEVVLVTEFAAAEEIAPATEAAPAELLDPELLDPMALMPPAAAAAPALEIAPAQPNVAPSITPPTQPKFSPAMKPPAVRPMFDDHFHLALTTVQSAALGVAVAAFVLAAFGMAARGWVSAHDWSCRVGLAENSCPPAPPPKSLGRAEIPS